MVGDDSVGSRVCGGDAVHLRSHFIPLNPLEHEHSNPSFVSVHSPLF